MNEIPSKVAFEPDFAHFPADHPRVPYGRIGVLLVNLGTPDDTTYWPMRRYLSEFLSDRRVIEINPLIWQPLLQLVILSRRPFNSGANYRSIWNEEKNESPLRTITRAQADLVAAQLAHEPRVHIDWAMRYGNPSIPSRLEALRAAGCERILIVPLYPQYAACTTATVADKAFASLIRMRWQPALRVAPAYHDDPVYIDAVATSMRASLAKLDFEPEVVIASFHGLPKEYLLKGDPYHCHCAKTTRLLREKLGWPKEKLRLTFQSRFGRAEWLQPYTDETIKALAEEGVRRLAVVTPGFAADCVETLEEIAIEGGEIFHEAGGEQYATLPCLNDAPESVALLTHLVRRELAGWI